MSFLAAAIWSDVAGFWSDGIEGMVEVDAAAVEDRCRLANDDPRRADNRSEGNILLCRYGMYLDLCTRWGFVL